MVIRPAQIWTPAGMAIVPAPGNPCHIWQLVFGRCRFIVAGEGLQARYCNGETDGSSWCAAHRVRVFARPAR